MLIRAPVSSMIERASSPSAASVADSRSRASALALLFVLTPTQPGGSVRAYPSLLEKSGRARLGSGGRPAVAVDPSGRLRVERLTGRREAQDGTARNERHGQEGHEQAGECVGACHEGD